MGMRRWVVPVATAIVVALVALGCSSDDNADRTGGRDSPFEAAELAYGLAPPREAEGLEYQPEVVIVGDGASAIRSMSPDGLSWTIDGSARGADELRVDSIMFVTGRAVGRVLAIKDAGDDKTVTVGPVELTEVYRELDLEFDGDIELAAMPLLGSPEMPGAITEVKLLDEEPAPDSTSSTLPENTVPDDTMPDTLPEDTLPPDTLPPDTLPEDTLPPDTLPEDTLPPDTVEGALGEPPTIELPPVRLVSSQAGPGGVQLTTSDVRPFGGPSGIGVGINYDRGGVKISGSLVLRLAAPTLRFDLKITPTGGIQTALVELTGSAGLSVDFSAASAVGLDNNINANITLPLEFSIPIFGAAPFAVTFSQRLLIKSAFSAKNSTLQASGDYSLSGGLRMGLDNGKLSLTGPQGGFAVKKSLVQSIQGISVGVNGMVLSHAVRVIVGIGALGFATGPYFDYVSSFGVTNGSDLGIVKCRGASLEMFLGAGIGYQIPQPVTKAINFILRALNLKQIQGNGGLQLARALVLHLEGITPISKICRE